MDIASILVQGRVRESYSRFQASIMPAHRRFLGAIFALLSLLVLLATPSRALAAGERELLFVQSNIEFILLHELAHVLINDLEVPIIGPEESAADYIATILLLLEEDVDQYQAERARFIVAAVASSFAADWDLRRPVISDLPFWDSHSLGMQRFFQITCLLYGSNPSMFPNLPVRAGLPPERAARCPDEFAKAERAVQWLRATYGINVGEQSPQITVDHQPPPSRVSRQVLESLHEAQVFERNVARLRSQFLLPEPFAISTQRCGNAQAHWDPQRRILVVCYELFDFYYLLARNPRSRVLKELLESKPNR